jgi:hypothetical protein
MIRKLREVDSQLFCGWQKYPSVYNMIGKIERVAALAASALRAALACEQGRSVVFVFTGCGTSGRFVFCQSTAACNRAPVHH